jgi:hypothetical protein
VPAKHTFALPVTFAILVDMQLLSGVDPNNVTSTNVKQIATLFAPIMVSVCIWLFNTVGWIGVSSVPVLPFLIRVKWVFYEYLVTWEEKKGTFYFS